MSSVVVSPASTNESRTETRQDLALQECLTCRIIGTGALAITGLYALNQSRVHAPGSPLGKRIMAGVGVCFLVGSVFRWNTK